jgi:hypothetical protein
LNVAGNVNSNLIPGVPSALTLGTASRKFKDLYLSGNINLPGSQSLTANTTTAIFSGNVYTPGALTANIIQANTANIDGTLTANAINANSITVNTKFTLNSSTNSTSTDTGAFTTTGGVGVQKDITVGGAINLANYAVTGSVVRSSIYHDDMSNSISFKFN